MSLTSITLNTTPTRVRYDSLVPTYFAPTGGDIKIERYQDDGTPTELSDSPVLNGEEVEVNTATFGQFLLVTASADPTKLVTQLTKGQLP